MEATLADIDRDGWELDDAEAIHNEFPTSFWLSSGSTDENAFLSTKSSSIQTQESFGPLDHLSAEQVQSILC